jgi:amino acid transporter
VMKQLSSSSDLSIILVTLEADLSCFGCRGDLVFLTEELKDPARDIPRGTIGGMSLVAIVCVRPT